MVFFFLEPSLVAIEVYIFIFLESGLPHGFDVEVLRPEDTLWSGLWIEVLTREVGDDSPEVQAKSLAMLHREVVLPSVGFLDFVARDGTHGLLDLHLSAFNQPGFIAVESYSGAGGVEEQARFALIFSLLELSGHLSEND